MSKLVRANQNIIVDGGVFRIHGQALTSQMTETFVETDDIDALRSDAQMHLAFAKQEAEAILTQAHEEAQRLLAEATRAAEEIKTSSFHEGRQMGYDEGLQQGRADAEVEKTAVLVQVQRVLKQAEEHRRRLMLANSGVFTEISMESVKQLLGRELSCGGADIEGMVSELLEFVMEASRVEIRVNPSDYQAATDARPKWQGVKFIDWEVVIIPDEGVTEGGCEIRTEHGRVDASMETKLAHLKQSILGVFERGVVDVVTEA